MKNLAVLIHGQPRFLNYTWKYIKEEYTIPDINTYYFGHLWEDVGFIPDDCLYKNYIKHNIEQNIINSFNSVSITNYDILDKKTKEFHPKIKIYLHEKCKNLEIRRDVVSKLRYRYGQHVSKEQAYNILCEYEKRNKIKFDIVVIVKTDFVYKNKECYKQGQQVYEKDKTDLYTDIEYNSNLAKNVTLCYEEWENYTKILKKYNVKSTHELPVHNKYNRLLVNDHWLVCSRDVASIFCTKWFETHEILLKELKEENVPKETLTELPKKYGCPFMMQGEIVLKNKIKLKQISKRFKRLVLLSNCKEKFLPDGKNGKEVIHNELRDVTIEQNYIQKRLKEIFT